MTSSTSGKKSVVDDYLEQIGLVAECKREPVYGLDPDFTWISVNALLLIGCLKCSGADSQKAEVFYRIVQPEMTDRILVFDELAYMFR